MRSLAKRRSAACGPVASGGAAKAPAAARVAAVAPPRNRSYASAMASRCARRSRTSASRSSTAWRSTRSLAGRRCEQATECRDPGPRPQGTPGRRAHPRPPVTTLPRFRARFRFRARSRPRPRSRSRNAEATLQAALQSAMPRPPVVLVAAVVLSSFACAPDPERRAPAGIALRFIAEEPAEVPTSDLLYASQPVFHWSFASPDEVARWRLRDLTATPLSGGRLRLEAIGPAAALERSVAARSSAGRPDRAAARGTALRSRRAVVGRASAAILAGAHERGRGG